MPTTNNDPTNLLNVKVFDIERSLAARSMIGGTGPEALLTQLAAAQAVVEAGA